MMFLSQPDETFSTRYIEARQKEQRVFSDEQVVTLPDVSKNHPFYDEWKLRGKSARRFLNYLRKKNHPQKILDIGCGNGWFSNLIANNGHNVTAVDINLPELEQAARVFEKPNLTFAYADIFKGNELQARRFDLIVFNSSFQYFSNAESTILKLRGLLTEGGEIHIIDSPFYKVNEIDHARKRTQAYYENLGFPDMAQFYFHHVFGDLGNYKVLYRPSFLNFIKKDSPFYWILILRTV
jgi:ubiquinone/menaquinone biosynthesis C-methylase UbiE